MEKRVSILLVCFAISALVMSTTSKGQLIDPSAEAGTTGPNGVGGWGTFGGAAFSADVAHSGTNSIKEFGAGGFSVPGAFQTFNAAPADAWTMTGFALTPGINTNLALADFGGLQITFFAGPLGTGANLGTVETSPGNAFFGNKITGASAANVWIPVSVTAHAPAGTESVQMFAITIDQTPTHIYFDDMAESATSVPEPSTVAMALTGLFGLVAFAKKRRV
jgi:PEP-CTERM motif